MSNVKQCETNIRHEHQLIQRFERLRSDQFLFDNLHSHRAASVLAVPHVAKLTLANLLDQVDVMRTEGKKTATTTQQQQ
jgi:hypothetical protein